MADLDGSSTYSSDRDIDGKPLSQSDSRVVTIPACDEHAGWHRMKVLLDWVCPRCGGPRGETFKTVSYDGSRRLNCDGWTNPCGHIDLYGDVRREFFATGRTAQEIQLGEPPLLERTEADHG